MQNLQTINSLISTAIKLHNANISFRTFLSSEWPIKVTIQSKALHVADATTKRYYEAYLDPDK